LQSLEETRREAEKKLETRGDNTPRPDWNQLERERREEKPILLMTIRNQAGDIVRRLEEPGKKGFHRVAWDLRYPSPTAQAKAVTVSNPDDRSAERNAGWLVPPGRYTVTLSKSVRGIITNLDEPQPFEVKRLREGVLKSQPAAETNLFLAQVADLERAVGAATLAISQAFDHIDMMRGALARSTAEPTALDVELGALKARLFTLEEALRGNHSRAGVGEAIPATILRRLEAIKMGNRFSTYGPTPTHRRSMEIAQAEFAPLLEELRQVLEVDLPALEDRMETAGVPWTPGRPLPRMGDPSK
jgi:hypothetical protein